MSIAESPSIPARGNMHVTEPGASAQSSFDIVQILWRWKWLPILGSIIGAGLGYLYFSKQPAEYIAEALVQVANALPSTSPRGPIYDPNEVIATASRADESMVIRSQKVLRLAVNKGRLTEQPYFAEYTADDIVAELMGTDDLVIEPADKDDNTTLILISYISEDADLAALVVNSIVDGYSDYLSEEYRTIGNEIYELITTAQTKLQDEYRKLNQQALQFQKEHNEVIWTMDGATDPYAENYRTLSAELSTIQVRRQKIAGTLQHVKQAMEAGRDPESILVMLLTEYSPAALSQVQSSLAGKGMPDGLDFELRIDTLASELERQELFPLQVREKELLDTVGPGHPSVAVIRGRIKAMQEQINRLRESERRVAKEQERMAMESIEAQGGIKNIQEKLDTRLKSLEEEYASLSIQAGELQKLADDSQAKSNELQLVLGNQRLMTSEIETIKELLQAYTEKLNEIELAPQAGQRILKELNLPSVGSFYGPKLPLYLLGGAAVGFVLLSGLAVLMDLADRSYRNPEEIANDLGVPVLGHIPVMDISKVKKTAQNVDASVTSIHHSKGRVSEAYRSVRTGLYFSQTGQNLKVLQVTSPVPGDGKSTLSSNLAVSMAQSGRRVLLIDADFRRPRIAKIFGIDGETGMAAVIAGKAEIEDAIHEGPVTNLFVMPGGKRPSNPAELLSSQRFSDLIDVLKDKFDIIIIDTPPLLAVSDPGAVAGIVDGVVLTMRLRRNVQPLAMRAIGILDGVGAKCFGVVVNGVSSEAGYGYNYDYNDYRYAYKYGSNYRSGYGYRYGYGNYRYGYTSAYEDDLSSAASANAAPSRPATDDTSDA
ncbi:MAG: polysaccharide biosynthesis tyrosine autokinase [bacterium]|nr:polysaccharide biosynthesis tyrosine autokinase [bacterium]